MLSQRTSAPHSYVTLGEGWSSPGLSLPICKVRHWDHPRWAHLLHPDGFALRCPRHTGASHLPVAFSCWGGWPRAGDVFPAACLAPLQLAWSSSCVAHSSDVTAGEIVTSGGGYPASGSSGLLPTGSLHGLLCYSEHLSANPDPTMG